VSLLAAALIALAGCAAAPGTVRTYGTLREALRDGATQARVDVAEIAGPTLCAVGAAAGLDGEITALDGACWISRVRGGAVQTERSHQAAATVLFAAEVARWTSVAVEADVHPAALEAFVGECARAAGLDPNAPFPFAVEGELLAMDVHVLAGQCPIRARMLGLPVTSPPWRARFDRVRGRLVGIHARDAAGVITHHGSATHVHAVVEGDSAFTGHCDAVGIAAGATLRLPAAWR
jgi:alpha-acetolactate decarboxylase